MVIGQDAPPWTLRLGRKLGDRVVPEVALHAPAVHVCSMYVELQATWPLWDAGHRSGHRAIAPPVHSHPPPTRLPPPDCTSLHQSIGQGPFQMTIFFGSAASKLPVLPRSYSSTFSRLTLHITLIPSSFPLRFSRVPLEERIHGV